MSLDKSELDSDNITKVLIKFSIPAIFALLIQSLYNLVDTIYVGHGVGSIGITALTIFYPMQILLVGIANLVAIGGGALISISLGKNKNEYANKIACNVILSLLLVGLILTVISFIYIKPILFFIGCTEISYPYVRDYAEVVFAGLTVSLLLQGIYALLRAEGKLKLIMITTIASVSLNTVLNPLFLFTFKMGMFGVSVATLLSQIIILIAIFFYYYKDKAIIKIRYIYFKPDIRIIYNSFLLGTSSMIRMSGASFLNILVNQIAGKYGGAEGIASFGLAYRLIVFMFMPILGFIQGGQPLLGYNYGAGNTHRIKKILKCSILLTVFISFIMLILVILFGQDIIYIFTSNKHIVAYTPRYLMGLSLALPLIAYQAVISGYLQAAGRVLAANITTIVRQFIFFVPAIVILPYFYEMYGLAASYLTSNIFSFTLIYLWMKKEKRVNLS